MAEALIRGLLGAGIDASQIGASCPRPERTAELQATYGIRTSCDNTEIAKHSSTLILAVKPQILGRVAAEVHDHIPDGALVISVAAGVPISAIEARLRPDARVVRVMPNTPALVGAGATAISGGSRATATDVGQTRFIFDAVGLTVVLDEEQLDAVTGLSGSGPSYIFLILEALTDAGVKVGLSRRTALQLSAQTVMGSARMLLETDRHPGQLKDMVTSPGGTAIAGLHTLEEGGLRTTLINAVESATRRSRELGARYAGGSDD